MGQSFLSKTKEAKGVMPAMGVKLKTESLEKTESKNGKLMYVFTGEVIEPEDYAGMLLKEWFVIGTDKDPKGKKEITWKQAEGGPGRLKRFLVRSQTPITDDDEEWCDAAEGQEVCAHVSVQNDDQGVPRNRIEGKYFRETDKDFVGVGESLEAGTDKKGAAASKPKPVGKPKPPPDDDDDDDDEKVVPVKAVKTKPIAPPDDDDDD